MTADEIVRFLIRISPKTLFIYSVLFMLGSYILSWKASAPQNPHNYLAPLTTDLCDTASSVLDQLALAFILYALIKILYHLFTNRNC